MTRLTKKQKAAIVRDFTDGISMAWLAESRRMPIYKIESIVRQAMKKVTP